MFMNIRGDKMRASLQFEIILAMADQLESLKTHLSIVKQMPADKIEEQFYNLMLKAKDALGETAYPMGTFYYEYGSFIISKMQKNLDIFNAGAVPNNVNEEAEEDLDHIPEVYDDSDSNLQQDLPEDAQNGENAQEGGNQPQNQEQSNPVAGEVANNPVEVPEKQEQQDVDDKEIGLSNIEFAISIFESELEKVRNSQSQTQINEILDGIRRAKTRLGDLYMLDEQYGKAIDEYRSVITQEEQRGDSDCSRLIAQIHFLIGNCFLYDNKQGCENLAIQQFIKAINILVNHLSFVEQYDTSGFELPSKDKFLVDRFAYLNKPNDSENVKQIKEVITCLLDKIEDTSEQIGVRIAYESEKKREEEEKKKSEFKPVQEGAKVINLGNFGNRKKKPDENTPTNIEDKQKQEK